MNKKHEYFLLVIVIGAALWAALVFITQKPTEAPTSPANIPLEKEVIPAFPTESKNALSDSEVSPSVPTLSSINFEPRLREIGQCLEIHNSLNENPKPTFSELQSSLASSLGELVETAMDWKNVHITLPNGEKRRLRIEVESSGEEAVHRQLQYYSVDAENLPVPIDLPSEQASNPTDTFIASLENEGEITMQEVAYRGVYTQGAELFYVEKNGELSEIEMSYRGKSVRCLDLNKDRANCTCF